ncbi:hypothetical protein CBFG_02338 [Clostridiales bacterium 1_7_47FAA]|nr:hypothetical protein CBFG_02338 [Clostridiales bacterium 1_7_47FAA]
MPRIIIIRCVMITLGILLKCEYIPYHFGKEWTVNIKFLVMEYSANNKIWKLPVCYNQCIP